MIQQLLIIGRNTFLESIRQMLYVVLLLLASLFIGINPFLPLWTLDDDNKMLLEVGLSSMTLFGVLLSAFTASAVVVREIQNQTILTIISKPVSRPAFVLGKFVGIAGAFLLAMWVMALVVFLSVRHGAMQTVREPFDQPVLLFGIGAYLVAIGIACAANYLSQKSFASTLVLSLVPLLTIASLLVMLLDKEWKFQSIATEFGTRGALHQGQVVMAMAMAAMLVLILAAVAVAAAMRLGQIATLSICLLFYAFGQAAPVILAERADESAVARVLANVAPNLQLFWQGDALTQAHAISLSHLGWVGVYALLNILAALGLAVALFQRREVG